MSFLLGKLLKGKLLDHRVDAHSTLRETAGLFSKGPCLWAHQQPMSLPTGSGPHQSSFVSLTVSILTNAELSLIVVLICIFLITNESEHLFYAS